MPSVGISKRVLGVDVELIRHEILAPENMIRHAALGDGRYPLGGGMVAVIRDGVVVTVESRERKR